MMRDPRDPRGGGGDPRDPRDPRGGDPRDPRDPRGGGGGDPRDPMNQMNAMGMNPMNNPMNPMGMNPMGNPMMNKNPMGNPMGNPMQPAKISTRSVFVGNIAYDTTEEELIEVFKEVGPVQSFRLLFDPRTGKPRGFGFCDYYDVESARSAMRNLNGREVRGRILRVDFADNDSVAPDLAPSLPAPFEPLGGPKIPGPPGGIAQPPFQPNPYLGYPPNAAPAPGQFPPQTGAPMTLEAATEGVTKTLHSLGSIELFDLMTQMKILIQRDPEQAKAILSDSPQLSYAFLQILLMLNLVRYEEVQAVLQKPAQSQPMMRPGPPTGPPLGGPLGGPPGAQFRQPMPPQGMMPYGAGGRPPMQGGGNAYYDQYRQ